MATLPLELGDSATASERFSVGATRQIVQDLFGPRPAIYWTDFLLSLGVGYFCFANIQDEKLFAWIMDATGWHGPWVKAGLIGLFFAVSCLALFRASLFTHELVHLRAGGVPGFRHVWNLTCGVPFLMPSFLYDTHLNHHVRRHYGTSDDGEYLLLASGPRRNILVYLAQSFVIPVIAYVRFAFLTPLAWLSPRARTLIRQKASSMVIDPRYIRPLPTADELKIWRRQELACFLFCHTVTAMLFTGVLPWIWLVHAYSTSVTIITLNAVRTLGAHRYRGTGQDMTFTEQLLDSVNYPCRPFMSELWAPVGLRFHALHHLFPGMPYHNLAQAHRRLMQELPADSAYRQTESQGLWCSLATLWREAGEARSADRRRSDDAREVEGSMSARQLVS